MPARPAVRQDVSPVQAAWRRGDVGALRVGMLGCGVVGTGVARLLVDHAGPVADRAGVPIELARIAVRDPTRKRDPAVDLTRVGGDAAAVVADDGVDVVVEVMGGFEAAVGGAIPIVAPLKESLAGERVRRVLGIVNGTTNYILWRMAAADAGYEEALADATALGYAEPDPSADVEGYDAASKCAILASLAFNTRVRASDVHREGITDVTAAHIAAARRMGYTIKLLAIAEEVDGQVSARVYPAMIPDAHPLAGVTEAYNAVFVEGDAVGRLMFCGRGAGGLETGSAVLGDLVGIARDRQQGARGVGCTCFHRLPVRPIQEVDTQYYLALDVLDQPGVLARVAAVFADHRVSIRSVLQRGKGEEAQLVLVTHLAPEGAMQAVQEDLDRLRGGGRA